MTKSTGIAPTPTADLVVQPLYLDIGCGKTPRIDKDAAGNVVKAFEGVDAIDFGQKHVIDVRQGLPWADCSVAEVSSSHFLEHLDGPERVSFMNEIYRVMEWGAKAVFATPHWSNDCAYGDPTHKWPPLSNWSVMYWQKAWRDVNAPHCGYTCDFDWGLGFSEDQAIAAFNQERRQFMANHSRNSMRDIWFHLVKTKR
jgi:hypothetical protein